MEETPNTLQNHRWYCNPVIGTRDRTRPRELDTAIRATFGVGIAAWDMESIKRSARAMATKTGERWNVWYQSNGTRLNEFKAIPSRK